MQGKTTYRNQGRQNRGQKGADPAPRDQERHQVQESPLYNFHRAGASPCLRTRRRGKGDLPL